MTVTTIIIIIMHIRSTDSSIIDFNPSKIIKWIKQSVVHLQAIKSIKNKMFTLFSKFTHNTIDKKTLICDNTVIKLLELNKLLTKMPRNKAYKPTLWY